MAPDFATFIIERRAATAGEVQAAVDQQTRARLPIGRLALQLGVLDTAQVFAILAQQTRHHGKLRFGEVAIEMKLLTPHQVDELLLAQRKHTPPLESFLVRAGILDADRARNLRAEFDLTRPSQMQMRAVVPRAKSA